MKNSLKGFRDRFKQLEERINKLKNSTTEMVMSQEQKEKILKKSE